MSKFSSYIKALTIAPQKAIRRLPHWENNIPISPKAQNDISGLVVPRSTADGWSNNIDIEYLQRMYDCHDLVYNCINLVSSTFALGKLKVKQKQSNGKYIYVPDHPLQRVLENPNSSMTGYDLRQSFIVHRLLFGTVAFILLRDDMIIDDSEANMCPACCESNAEMCYHILWNFHTGPITQIIPVHLDRLGKKVFEMPDGKKKEYFIYSPQQGIEKMPVHPDNILTDPNYNPAVSFYGSSPTAKVQRWLEIDLGLSKQIGAYFLNNAIPSMVLNLKPARPESGGYEKDPSEMLNMMKENWMRKFSLAGDGYQEGKEVRSPAFVYGDIDVLKIQDTLKDIVLKPLFYEIQSRIAMAYQVPRAFFEFGLDYASQSATAKQQREDFFNDAIAPQLITFKAKVERYILPSFEDADSLQLEWDLSNMGVASFLEEKKKAQILKEWEMGLETRDATRELLGKDPLGGEVGDDLYRITVMSDGNNNNAQLGGTLRPKGKLEDNRLKPNPQLTQDAGGSEF